MVRSTSVAGTLLDPALHRPRPMRVFVLGKLGSIVRWTEGAVAGLRAAGHDVRLGVTRDTRLNPLIERWLAADSLGAPRAVRLIRAIRRFDPNVILAVSPYRMPPDIVERVSALPGRPPLLGWVGDAFSPTEQRTAQWLDAVGYTDSGMLAQHNDWRFPCPAIYLPHAANPLLAHAKSAVTARRPCLVFVGSPTAHRRALVGQVRSPMVVFGKDWTADPANRHDIRARRIGMDRLAIVYRSYLAALNIRHEHNVLLGLNQRHFDPYLGETPVVTDAQADLERCFDPGREVLVYRDADELNDIYARLRGEPRLAAALGARGHQRVLAEHTYARRLETLMAPIAAGAAARHGPR